MSFFRNIPLDKRNVGGNILTRTTRSEERDPQINPHQKSSRNLKVPTRAAPPTNLPLVRHLLEGSPKPGQRLRHRNGHQRWPSGSSLGGRGRRVDSHFHSGQDGILPHHFRPSRLVAAFAQHLTRHRRTLLPGRSWRGRLNLAENPTPSPILLSSRPCLRTRICT